MVSVTFISHDGRQYRVDAEPEASVMLAARNNGVPGILAECGGACACATCQVFISDEWAEAVGGPSEIEELTLEFAQEQGPNRRLSCQIRVTQALDGLIVRLPAEQG